jgi:BolA protein
MVTIASTIYRKLSEGLAPASLSVTDDSARHAGHAGARAEGETHFRVEVISSAFIGLKRVDRQQLVYRLLAEELAGRVHALEISTLTPEEAERHSRAGS